MPLTPQHRKELLIATREAAAAFIEDMQHIRGLLTQLDPSRGDLRLLSGILRRLLVDRDITKISAPRNGRFKFLAPDNKPVYREGKKLPYVFFASAGVSVLGVIMRAAILDRGSPIRNLGDLDSERMVELSLDGFLSQPVLCLEGSWVSRRTVIKYAANIASGVHSGTPQELEEKILARISRSVTYSAQGQTVTCSVSLGAIHPIEPPFHYAPDKIDAVLVELLAAAHFLAISSDTKKLEETIRKELTGT